MIKDLLDDMLRHVPVDQDCPQRYLYSILKNAW